MTPGGTIHATCVALGDDAVLLTGRSGAGKSDLALRLIDRGWMLVSDDYTVVTVRDGRVRAAAPPAIAGRIELHGVGILPCPHRDDVAVALVCALDGPVDRMPESRNETVAGIDLPCIALAALEPSAPMKLEWALRGMTGR